MRKVFSYHDFIFELHAQNVESVRKKWYNDIENDIFEQIISADPTTIIRNDEIKKMGNYSKWLLKLYKEGNLLIEDLYKATEYLTIHKNNQSILAKYDERRPPSKKVLNVFNFKSLNDLYKIVSNFDKPKEVVDEDQLISNRYYLNNDEADLVYEDDKYLIVNVLTLDAENFYGVNSKWCTLKSGSFETYTKSGPLYIIIDKTKLNTQDNDRRLQLSISHQQYMNIIDTRVGYGYILSELKSKPELKPLIDELLSKNVEIIGCDDLYQLFKENNFEKLNVSSGDYPVASQLDDSRYLEVLEKIRNLNRNNIIEFLTKNRPINSPIYLEYIKPFDDQFKLKIIIKNMDCTWLVEIFDDSVREKYATAFRLMTTEKIYSSELNSFLKTDNSLEDKIAYAKSKSEKWIFAMILYVLDTFDVTKPSTKALCLAFKDRLIHIKEYNNLRGDFPLGELLNKLYISDTVTEMSRSEFLRIRRKKAIDKLLASITS